MTGKTNTKTDTAEERMTARQWEERFEADAATEAAEADATFALEAETRRAYDEAWREYKSARSRFMDMVLNGGDDVPVDQRLGHEDLTRMERQIILTEREQRARSAWGILQDAQFNYMLAVDPSVEVEPRKP